MNFISGVTNLIHFSLREDIFDGSEDLIGKTFPLVYNEC